MAKFKKNVGVTLRRSSAVFRVWAPFASSVAVTGPFNDWSEQPLTSEDDGYWSAEVRGVIAGQEYQYVIKNGDQTFRRNDPRALHIVSAGGNSVITDPRFDWGNDQFQPIPYEQQVIYELHVGTFNRPDPAISGTFQDVADKLDYLSELGVNMIELMPIGSMPDDRGWGYAIDYIYAVESLYGGRRGLQEFVKAAHAKGIGVILDVVYNHFGPDNNFDLWQFDGWQQDGKGGIYFYNDWRAATPWGETRPDYGRLEVQQYILDNVRQWLHDCRIDGLRVDSTIYIRNVKGNNDDPGNDLPEGWQLLQQINGLARKINPGAITIAEDVGVNDYLTKPVNEGGAGFVSQWDLMWPHALRQALTSDRPGTVQLDEICGLLTKRFNNNALERIIFVDSHDSAANGSSRLNETLAAGDADGLFARKQTLLAATLILTAPAIPMLFQGQEFMATGNFTDWRSLDWEQAERHAGIVAAYKQLISLRKNNANLTAGLLGQNINLFHVDKTNGVLAYHRWQRGGSGDDTLIIINFSGQKLDNYSLSIPVDGTWQACFNSAAQEYSADFTNLLVPNITVVSNSATLSLPANTALIFSRAS